jgi:DNA-binding protein HU-beta
VAVNRTELVDAVAAETGLERKQAEAAVKAFSDAVITETKSGEKVSIFGFGTFTPTARAARMGRNPQTNTPVKIAASKGVRFSPASAFKTTLNSKKAAPKKAAARKAVATKAPAKSATRTTAAKSSAAKTTAAKTTAVKKTVATKAPTVKKAVAQKAAPAARKVSTATTKAANKVTKATKATKKR